MSANAKPLPSLRRFFIALVIAAFALNWLWEMVQMPAYAEMAGRPWVGTALRCGLAAVGDVVAILAVVAVGSLAAGQLRWAMTRAWNVYAAAALLGATVATIYELISLSSGRWTYTESMPIMPLLRVGLWPLLQLSVLTPLVVWLATRWTFRARK